uniref:SLC41A/MgtE integral membrane domain-containing protein n=1 Tax=Megaselia scalaris TaxID=36166 RepID=T1H3S4_MEGSC
MCLASRLSTQANLGNMTSRKEIFKMIAGNISLVQVQSIVASFLVAVFAISVGFAINSTSEFEFDHVLLIIAAAMFTATSSCFVLDFVLVAVILLSRKYNMNPDNLATPLAASIGDVVSISLFSFIVQLLYTNIDNDNEKLSGLPHSTTGSLSSIITTSIASSEPDTGFVGSGDEKFCGSDGPGSGGPGGDDKNISAAESRLKQEKWTTILLEVSIPFFLAGIGTIGAGIILGRVEDWDVFKHIPELYILVPALLGLKGNLDMCLASRLSTQANLGNMTSRKEIFKMI